VRWVVLGVLMSMRPCLRSFAQPEGAINSF
jgi:hypothetical protein